LPTRPAVCQGTAARRDPTVLVDGPVCEHLEILYRAPAPCRCVVEGIGDRHALDRLLHDPVDRVGRRYSRHLENGRHNVDDVVELSTQFPLRLDAFGPMHDQRIARAAEVGCDLLHPLERGLHGPRPTHGHMRLAGGAADLVDAFDRAGQSKLDAEQAGKLAEGALQAAFRAGPLSPTM